MTIEISTQIRIQQHEGYWYTVEDTHLDAGCDEVYEEPRDFEDMCDG